MPLIETHITVSNLADVELCSSVSRPLREVIYGTDSVIYVTVLKVMEGATLRGSVYSWYRFLHFPLTVHCLHAPSFPS